MLALLTIIALGLILGMRHATDPDHVIAVSTIVSREHNVKRSALIGVAWGIGHTLTILLVGSAMILFRIKLPPRIGLSMELAVALMLIALGIKNLSPRLRWRGQAGISLPVDSSSYHSHGDYVHAHRHAGDVGHAHDPHHTPVAIIDNWFQNLGLYTHLRPFIIGVVHGLAGSAAIALLVLSTISNLFLAMVYLIVFGLGTVLGMMLITLTMASTFAYGQRRLKVIGRHLGWAAGLVSLVFGFFIAYQVGIVDGLFRSQASWIPR